MFAFWYQEWHFDGYTTHEYELSDIGEVALGAAEPEFESFSAKANLISVPEGEALLLPIQGAEDHTPLAPPTALSLLEGSGEWTPHSTHLAPPLARAVEGRF